MKGQQVGKQNKAVNALCLRLVKEPESTSLDRSLRAIIHAGVDHSYWAQRLTDATLLQKLYLVHNSRSLMMMRLAH